MKSVLITGVAGFIGSNLADRLLRDGYRVVGIDNLSYGVAEQIPDGVEFHQLDIRDRAAARLYHGIDVVFHLAAKNCIADCQLDPVETFDINVHGSARVFDAARLAGVRKVVYAESSALYEGVETFPTDESTIKPQSFYALSKEAGMLIADGYRRFYDVRSTALRYFCVYGPRQDYRRTIPPVMSAFIIKLLKGERPTVYGSGKKRRDFVYVDDVNDFHVRCITDDRTDGRTFNLGSGTNHSVEEIFRAVAGLLQSRIEPVHAGDLPGEAEVTLADIRAAQSVGWRPRITLEDGLRRSIEYISEHVLGDVGAVGRGSR